MIPIFWTKVLFVLGLAFGIAWIVALSHEMGLHPAGWLAAELRNRPIWETAFLAIIVLGFIHHGATKGTNGVNGAGGELGGFSHQPPTTNYQLPTINDQLPTINDQLPTTNCHLPTTNSDWLAFGGYEDWFRIPEGDWCFRFGSNLAERLAVFASGEVRTSPHDVSNRISLLGLPLSIVPAANWHLIPQPPTLNPQQSLFWHAITPSNSLLLTWRNALVNRDTNLPVTVQAELFPDGAVAIQYGFSGLADTSILSNAAVRIWRDGEVDEVPLQTGTVTAVSLPAPPVMDTNALDEVYARIAGVDSNAYYFAEAVVGKGPARIDVEADGDSALGSYRLMAEPGVTNLLPLLIGPRYAVSSEVAFSHFALMPSEMQTVESHPSATNVTDRVVEVRWPVEFGLDEVSASPAETVYALHVVPDFLCGTVSWSGATANGPMRGAPPLRSGGDGCTCGCQSYSTNTVSHASSCTCGECAVSGDYGYEGHSEHFELPFPDTAGGDPPDPGGDGGDPDPPSPTPSVSVSFEKPVVIFEDGYTNSLGVFVARQSTRTKLTLTARGGDSGCTFHLAVSTKLQQVAGGALPPAYVAANAEMEWSAYYEGSEASSQVGDARANVTYTNSQTGETITTPDAEVTVVKVKVTPINGAPADMRPDRHKLGVYEIVSCQQFPTSPQVEWNAPSGYFYNEGSSLYYRCPLYSDTVAIEAAVGTITHSVNLSIVSPQGIEAKNMSRIEYGVHPGFAGYVGMRFVLHALPYDVSFEEISIEEVPCDQGSHTGYFAQPAFSNIWYHTRGNGAGNWNKVEYGNRCGIDEAAYTTSIPKVYLSGLNGDPLLGWYYGYLSWNVPFGWNISGTTGAAPEYSQFSTDTRQEIILDAEGTVTVSKLGCWISRSTNEVIMLYGDVQ